MTDISTRNLVLFVPKLMVGLADFYQIVNHLSISYLTKPCLLVKPYSTTSSLLHHMDVGKNAANSAKIGLVDMMDRYSRARYMKISNSEKKNRK